ncbi:MAG: GTP pyrophosphokinase family protein [Oscillospiraceae bacterium]|nr:GTP pyrophosphokinase family protein [Clostridia bacterium]MBP3699586.1 GTP pyrophosphokinase family protein [Oscillospiraceae bacterium]
MSQNMNFPTIPPEQLAQLLSNDHVMNALYDRAKSMMWSMVQYKELQMLYSCALKEIQTKFEVLDTEFKLEYNRNPIASISTRLKRTESIMDKLERKGLPFNYTSIEEHIHDVAGIRVICSYIDDIYLIADALLRQDDITLIARKDYIEHPKDNGYRSLHLIVEVPVFLTNHKKPMKVEVQIRTIAMDFWASLEHQMKYKQEIPDEKAIMDELKDCADVIRETDERMLAIRRRIEAAADIPTEEDVLFDKLARFDIPIQ